MNAVNPRMRTMTLMVRGDITLGWTEDNDEIIHKMIEEKLRQGFTFFIVDRDDRHIRVRSINDIDRRQIIIPDREAAEILKAAGAVLVQTNDTSEINTTKVSTDPKEIASNHSVAVPPMRGG